MLLPSLLVWKLSAAQHLYRDAKFDVKTTTDVTYAQALTCEDGVYPGKECKPMSLQLDVYEPVASGGALTATPVPPRKPAYILSHGGGNSGGSKEQYCFQGAAKFYAARGMVAFNINYRLAHDKGLLPNCTVPGGCGSLRPPPPAPPPPAQAGDKLVSHVRRSDDWFFPHPSRTPGHGAPYVGPLRLGSDTGALCISAEAAGAAAAAATASAALPQLTLQLCSDAAKSTQHWRLEHNTIAPQHIVHVGSGLCMGIPAAGAAAQAGLPIALSQCNGPDDGPAHSSSNSTQMWQLGFSGALITRGAEMSVGVAVAGHAPSTGWEAATRSREWTPSWNSGYPAVRDLKAAIRFVRAHAEEYGVDASRITVSGGSAGATNSVRPKWLVVELSWSQFTGECQRFDTHRDSITIRSGRRSPRA
jgi:hypothetical protein